MRKCRGLKSICFSTYSILPVIWDGPNSLSFVEVFSVVMFWIIMNENRRVPTAIEFVRSTMETLGRLVEQHITTGQDYFMCYTLIVLNLSKVVDQVYSEQLKNDKLTTYQFYSSVHTKIGHGSASSLESICKMKLITCV